MNETKRITLRDNYIIAIETSCDDTSIAILHNQKVLSNVVISSTKMHSQYGGIVPEIAARNHEQQILKCFQKALMESKLKINQITHIAYTNEPGLPGSLHVGKIFAKTLSDLLQKPLLKVNHLLGHIYSFGINQMSTIKHPFLSLIVSGGHTSIYLVKSIDNWKVINQTTDEAAGEMLDKIGRLLSLPYPGGIAIDKLYDKKYTKFPLIKHFQAKDNFSFSGFRTHISNYINHCKQKKIKLDKTLISSSTLQWIVDELLIKLNFYIKSLKIKHLAVGGGVSANTLLRQSLKKLSINVRLPEINYTNDNAAMIGFVAYLVIKKN